jgi:hypothetical protein
VRTAPLAEAVILDDRYFNQRATVTHDGVATPIRTTNDLLLARQLPSTEFVELFTRVRVAGLAFLPVTGEEISALLARTTVVEGYLSETAELKALRESLEMYRMSQGLQLPAEAVWYEDVVRALLRALRAEWTSDADVQLARTRSSWLLQELDLRGWSHGDKHVGFQKLGTPFHRVFQNHCPL